jgi:hypothetical protein
LSLQHLLLRRRLPLRLPPSRETVSTELLLLGAAASAAAGSAAAA